MPSPQVAEQLLPEQSQPVSSAQVAEQPSPEVVLLSSHSSSLAIVPSPQVLVHREGLPVQL